ncbi:ATP-binding protein [Ferrigenium sp. UT5]|uniref:ATP-binding protein n=1 Tax=Ferrigenium sp. UT5 TaxID=3242105 RepID=UPI00354B7201
MLTLDSLRGPQSSRWLSLALLFTLHGALWLGLEHPLARPLLFMHLGFFLVWQPLWRSEASLSRTRALAILAGSLLVLIWLNGWLLAFWVAGLFALVGARIVTFYTRWQRIYHLLMLSYLLAVLLLYLAPQLFALSGLPEVTHNLMDYGLPLLLLLMALLPVERERAQAAQAVDFIYVIMLFMLVVVLVLGALAFMTLSHVNYLTALLGTLSFMATALFILGVLWRPQSVFGGFDVVFSRYVLSIGTPLETWLQQLADDAQQLQTPQDFLHSASAHLADLPWVAGVAWVAEAGHGNLGVSTPHRVELADRDLSVTLFMRASVAPGVLLHLRLLVRVLDHFYQAKRREQRLREITRQQALYETGARLTHDLKNMLQSLFALTSLAQHEPAKAQPVLQRQLPQLTQRIETLLGKLKSPTDTAEEMPMPWLDWWNRLRERYSHREIEWSVQGERASSIPAELFDCVADNLIENASNKRLREAGIRITVRLDTEAQTFSVSDSGSAIPAQQAHALLHTVVPSEDGLGVGLYQAARLALQLGWQLYLAENRPGKVRFELKRMSD